MTHQTPGTLPTTPADPSRCSHEPQNEEQGHPVDRRSHATANPSDTAESSDTESLAGIFWWVAPGIFWPILIALAIPIIILGGLLAMVMPATIPPFGLVILILFLASKK